MDCQCPAAEEFAEKVGHDALIFMCEEDSVEAQELCPSCAEGDCLVLQLESANGESFVFRHFVIPELKRPGIMLVSPVGVHAFSFN